MARRPETGDEAAARVALTRALTAFDAEGDGEGDGDLRTRVRRLAEARRALGDLGASLLREGAPRSARARILSYLLAHVGEVVAGEELMVVSGIQDYPRRIRELRVEHGRPIISGAALNEMRAEQGIETGDGRAAPDDYVLLSDAVDADAAARWRLANDLRKSGESVKARLVAYLTAHVGRAVTGEELRYVCGDASEWARRVRELRTQEGRRIETRFTGRPDLAVGLYVLTTEARDAPHDRRIRDETRLAVLERDGYGCRFAGCGFVQGAPDPAGMARRIEIHHKRLHAKGGANDAGNLVALCNVHHDRVHREGLDETTIETVLAPSGGA